MLCTKIVLKLPKQKTIFVHNMFWIFIFMGKKFVNQQIICSHIVLLTKIYLFLEKSFKFLNKKVNNRYCLKIINCTSFTQGKSLSIFSNFLSDFFTSSKNSLFLLYFSCFDTTKWMKWTSVLTTYLAYLTCDVIIG